MTISIIAGPINSGKTSEMRRIFENSLNDRSCICVVPTEAVSSQFRRNIMSRALPDGRSAIMGDTIISWSRFIDLIANPAKPILTIFQSSLLIFRLIARNNLCYFKSKRPSIGIARQFAETIIALKQNGVGPNRLKKLLDTRGGLKENDLLATFERYESALHVLGVIDEGDLYEIFLSRIKKGDVPILKVIRSVILDEFRAFSPGQISLIREFRRSFPELDLRISFPTPHDDDSLYSGYLNQGFDGIAEIADKVVKFSCDQKPPPPVAVRSARSPLQESRGVIDFISTLLNENGLNRDQVILTSRMSGNLLGSILNEAMNMGVIQHGSIPRCAFDAPILHELLSSESIDEWPVDGSMEDFSRLCIEFMNGRRTVEMWSDHIGSELSNRFDIGRSLSSASRLDGILKELNMTSRLLDLRSIRREPYMQILLDKLGQPSSHMAAERHLPFCHLPFEAGLCFPAEHVIMPRMIEGNIPRARGERLFFSEADKLSPEPDDIIDAIFLTSEDALASDTYLFDTFMHKCLSGLMLTYPIIDDGGSETSPSSLLDERPDAIPFEPAEMSPVIASDPGWTKKLGHLVDIEMERRRGTPKHSKYHGCIASKEAKELVRMRFTSGKFSATSLEKYATCPFTFFVEKVLGLEPREEEMPELIPKDRGTILHAVLERFYLEHLDSLKEFMSDPGLKAKIPSSIDRLIEEVFRDKQEIIDGVAPGLKPLQRQMIKTMAMQVINMEIEQSRHLRSPLMPFKCEWGFGENDVEDLRIPVKNDVPARMHGWVDRIDLDVEKKKFLVIDYKTRSAAKSVKQEILSGLKLQLPIYVEAVQHLLLPGKLPLGGLLIDVLSAEKRHGFVRKEYNDVHYMIGKAHSGMSEELWNESMAAAISACSAYVAAIRSGIFDVSPKVECPSYCDYAEICRYSGKDSN